MGESDPPGMQHQSLSPPTVQGISNDRMTDVVEVNANLMRPAGAWRDKKKGRCIISSQHTKL